MNPRHVLARGLVPLTLLALPVGLLGGSSQAAVQLQDPAADQAVQSALAPTQTGTLFQETFESGAQAWTTSARTAFKTVGKGRRSETSARLRARTPGAVVAKTVVPARSAVGSSHVSTAWVRSLRGPVTARLVVREVEPATGAVLRKARDKVKARATWKKAKVRLVNSSPTSVFAVTVRAKQGRGDRVLVDDVKVRRTKTRGETPMTAPTPPTPAGGAFPNAANTGVPDGLALAPYGGPMSVTTPGAVIDGKQINGAISIKAPNVTITRSQVNGAVVVERSGSLTLTDSTVNGGTSENSAVGQYNLTMRRVEVVGARVSVGCSGNCDVQDSWLHGQYMQPGSDWHGDGFLSNGGDNMTLRHNTLACDSKPTGNGGACSAALAAYGDFEPITNLTVDNNLFVESPAGYCMYGGYDPSKAYGRSASNVVVTNNVFARGGNGKCGAFGAVSAVAPSGSNGNVFSGNVWDDGRALGRP